MNAVLTSHGYDAILVPAAAKREYTDVVISALRSGSLDEHIEFLLSHYGDK